MGSKILLADDSITIQKVVNLTFADEGIEVVAVSNGDTAERRLAEVNPDLVLADIFMPGKNGYELCESIKKSAQFSRVPVVLLIGAFEPFNEAEARRVHADAHLTKPFESRTLVETVRKLINVGGKPRTGPITPAPAPEAKNEEPRRSVTTNNMAALGPADFPPATEAAPVAPSYEMSTDSLNDAAPLDLDYSSAEMPVSMSTDANSLSGWTRRTDELSFSTDQAPFQSFNLNDLNAEASELSAPISVAVEEHPADFSLNSQVVETPLSFRDAADMRLDYGKAESREDYEVIGFDVDARDPLDVDAGQFRSEQESEPQTSQPHSFDTTRLDISKSYMEGDASVDTNPLETPAVSGDVSFSFGGQASDSGDPSSLLAVDEPLGDVLMGESVRESFPADSEQPLDQSLTGEAFSIEFTPHETASALPVELSETAATATTDFEVTRGESESAPVQADDLQATGEQQTIVSETASFEVVSAPAEETAQMDARSETLSEPALDSYSAYGFEIAEQVENHVQHDSNDSASQETVLDSSFTEYSTWQNEETRFAPIDIEATPVDETAVADVKDEPSVSETEKGFEFTSAAAVETEASEPLANEPLAIQEPVQSNAPVSEAPSTEVLSAQEPSTVEAIAPETTAQAIDFSPALIDEIVRRVVAQMSDSVVREIAWEVVPDCVERVIKDMTRQELSKR